MAKRPPALPEPAPRRLPIVGQPEIAPESGKERADAARNRTRILAAARRLLGRRPIHEICMDEVAKAAGVGKGTLYRRFADRSSLCLALLDDSERLLQERVLAGFDLPREAPAVERLLVLLDALVTFALENAALLAEAAAFERGRAARVDHPVHAWRKRELSRHIALAQRAGSAPPLDAEMAADLILAGLDPDLMLRKRERADDAALRRSYLEFFARSLGLSAVALPA
jgi:AcrR family transcriptional regulator